MRSAIAIMLLFWCAVGLMAEEFILSPGIKGCIEPGNKDMAVIREQLRLTDRISTRILLQKGNERGSLDVLIMVVNHPLTGNFEIEQIKKRTVIYLPGEFRKWQNDYTVQKRLMAAMLLLKCGLTPTSSSDLDCLPPWLLTGALEYQDLRQGRDIFSGRNYFELRALDHFGAGMTLDDTITGDYNPEDGVFFDLFSQSSETLLSLCLSAATTKDNFIREMIVLSFQRSKTRPEVFFATAGTRLLKKIDRRALQDKTISEQEKVRNWYRAILFTRNINFFYPRSSKEIAERFNTLLVQSVKAEDKKGQETTISCKLEDLAANWQQLIDPDQILNDTRQELLKLQNESPYELISPLGRIYSALNDWQELQYKPAATEPQSGGSPQKEPPPGLPMSPQQQAALQQQATKQKQPEKREKKEMTAEERETHAAAFRREVQTGISDFKKACLEYEQVEEFLLNQEKIMVPAEMRYYYRLKSLDDMDFLNRKIWPDINNYLDGLEKEYFKY